MASEKNILTTKIRNGRIVLAKETKHGINAVTYVNNKQAAKKVNELNNNGISCYYSEFDSIKFIYIK